MVVRSSTTYASSPTRKRETARVELWGAALFGDPCRECAFDWLISPADALTWTSQAARRFEDVARGAAGVERAEGWSVSEYVSHVSDNLRQWAERVQGARLVGALNVSGYDPDELGRARNYGSIPLAVAVWSLEVSARLWCGVLYDAFAEGIVLEHVTRGRQTATDIVRNNTHDAYHHVFDVRRILG